jgi:hypothetical protein
MSLNPGTMAANGTLSAGSMAAAIESALASLVPPNGLDDELGRRKLALAVARGVLGHIKDNATAVKVTVPDTAAGGATHQQQVTLDIDLTT